MTSKISQFMALQKFNRSKTILLTFGIIMLLASCGSVDKHNLQVTQLHPVEDIHEDIDKVYKQLQRHHPLLYQFVSKEVLDFKFDSLKKAINSKFIRTKNKK